MILLLIVHSQLPKAFYTPPMKILVVRLRFRGDFSSIEIQNKLLQMISII